MTSDFIEYIPVNMKLTRVDKSVNSISISGMLTPSHLLGQKSEAKMAAHGGKFWTSVSVLCAVLYISSSLLHDFNYQFLFGSALKTFTTMEKVFRRNLTRPVFHIRIFKKSHYCLVAYEMS